VSWRVLALAALLLPLSVGKFLFAELRVRLT
jgi:hypothetical protein